MTVFLFLSFLLLFSLKREEARMLTLLLIPTFFIVAGSGIVHPLPYYRVPYDFLFFLGAVGSIQMNRFLRRILAFPLPR